MTKEEFVTERTKIISRMLDNVDKYGIYSTTVCFSELDDLFDKICVEVGQQPWAPSGAQEIVKGLK